MKVNALLYPALAHGASIRPRATDGISSCGDLWMPTDNVQIAQGTDSRTGYNSAVQKFCDAANGQTVRRNGFLSMATEVFLSGGKNPTEYGVLGFLYFEVHNKQDSDHVVSGGDCQRYLKAMSADGSKCFGHDNHDTKGGTWQVGNNAVSYHAIGNEVPPQQDGLNKLFTMAALVPQNVNKGRGPPLSPWPFDSTNGIKPTSCHSHNDYDRDIPLFSAMSAGCVSFEADVFYSNNDVIIGHSSPTAGRTLTLQYAQPLREILDHNNGGSPGNNGLYKSSPQQSVTLLVDFKTSDSRTLDAVVKALQPLRDGNYLSHVSNNQFVQRPVTIVASGSAPFDRINAGDGVPNRDIFYDAHIDQWDAKYNKLNSYYASASFKSDIGNPGSANDFTQAQKDKTRAQIQKAHDAGLLVRYWDLPGDYMWEPLSALGDDRLNADDMYDTARLPRI